MQLPPDLPERVLSSEVLVWAGIALAILTYGVTASERLQKILGPLGRWVGERQLRRMQRADLVSDARVADLREEVEHLRAEVQRYRREQAGMWSALRVHARWDDAVAHQVRNLGGDVPDPPPLYPEPVG